MSGALAAAAFCGKNAQDKTPAAIDWDDITGINSGENSDKTISGINVTITLQITFTGSGLLYYNKNSGGNISISSGGTFTVVSGDSVHFYATPPGGFSVSGTVTVANSSDGGATLDTFTYSIAFI